MKNNKKILIGILVLISLLIILPFFIPVKTYLNKAETLASDELGVPVSISSGHLLLFPSPRLVLNQLKVGATEEIKVERVTVIPSLTSIFSESKIIDVKVNKLNIKKSALDILPIMMSNDAQTSREPNPIYIKQVVIDELTLDWPEIKSPIFKLELNLTSDNKLATAKLEASDNSVQANLTPESEGHYISIKANKWTVPVGLPLYIDHAELDMHLKSDRLEIPRVDVALYGGKMTANLNVLWNKNWRTSGNVKVDKVAVKEPSRLVSRAVYLSGDLSGNGSFSGSAKDAGKLVDHLNTDFRFKVNNGVLHGLDLIKLASLLTKQATGGKTAFDELSGKLNAKGKQYHLSNLKIGSGYLAGTGQVKISANKELDGTGEVELKHSVSLVSIPLDVSGTVENPVVLPSKAALAGAVAGTALLGPGVGTSLGVKAGSMLNRIKESFGSQKP